MLFQCRLRMQSSVKRCANLTLTLPFDFFNRRFASRLFLLWKKRFASLVCYVWVVLTDIRTGKTPLGLPHNKQPIYFLAVTYVEITALTSRVTTFDDDLTPVVEERETPESLDETTTTTTTTTTLRRPRSTSRDDDDDGQMMDVKMSSSDSDPDSRKLQGTLWRPLFRRLNLTGTIKAFKDLRSSPRMELPPGEHKILNTSAGMFAWTVIITSCTPTYKLFNILLSDAHSTQCGFAAVRFSFIRLSIRLSAILIFLQFRMLCCLEVKLRK